MNQNDMTKSIECPASWLASVLVAIFFAIAPVSGKAAPWQSITQPIGTLLIDPPQSALQVNQYLMSLDPNITPATYPFDLSTDVTKIQTTEPLYFVRVYNEASGSRPVGSWIMRASQARGLTAAEIRNIQALPALPTHFTLVKVPAGITMYTGVAGPIEGWGDGGATQSKMMGPPYVPIANFTNQQLIGNCFLCYRTLAPTGNAHEVGAALDRAAPVAYSILDTLYDQLDTLYFAPRPGPFQDALNALSGESITASQHVVFQNTASFMESVRQNTAGWLLSKRSLFSVSSDSTAGKQYEARSTQNGLWASIRGSTLHLNGNDSYAGIAASGATLSVGMNRQVNPNFLAGFAFGASNASYSVNDRHGTGTVNGMNAALFAVARADALYLSGALAYGWSNTGTNRDITVASLFDQQKSSFTSQVISMRLETGYTLRTSRANITPFAAIEPAWLWQGGFSEQSRGSQPVNMGLDVQSRQTNALPLSLGVQIDSSHALSHGWTLNPLIRISWIHEFNPTRQINASLQLLPQQSFTVTGASAPINTGRVLLGVTATHRSGMTGYVSVDATLSHNSQAFGAWAGLGWRF